ncbi:MAG TPA: succinylglutamate desuccinylase/aspartoacylase family protein [Acidimicrobiia bacterium]|nr:succinylglutamate desuccinylase/aspartoacylase family protein [Acidimicrobiia bacterium]
MPETKVNHPIKIGGVTVAPGRKVQIDLPFAEVVTAATESLPVKVVNGRAAGPNIWLSAAIHGDELNGIQIIRRVLREVDARKLRGALIAVPIVNPLGFITQSRYLPDHRDLNRSFPGSRRGSSASRLAHLFMAEIVAQCTVGIDIHTASNHRINAPQIRANLDDEDTLRLARAFGAPFSIHARLRDGSLRQAATEQGKTVILYEAGQANRFDDDAIETGVDGVMRTLRAMGMLDSRLPKGARTRLIRRTRWVRARRGGIVELGVALGERVEKGQTVASVSDAFGTRPARVRALESGWVLARTLRPLVNSGDPLVHIGAERGPDRDEPAETKR